MGKQRKWGKRKEGDTYLQLILVAIHFRLRAVEVDIVSNTQCKSLNTIYRNHAKLSRHINPNCKGGEGGDGQVEPCNLVKIRSDPKKTPDPTI